MDKMTQIHNAFHKVAEAIADAHKYNISPKEYGMIRREISDTIELLNYFIAYDECNKPEPEPEPEEEEDHDRHELLLLVREILNIISNVDEEVDTISLFNEDDPIEFIQRVTEFSGELNITLSKKLVDELREVDNTLFALLLLAYAK